MDRLITAQWSWTCFLFWTATGARHSRHPPNVTVSAVWSYLWGILAMKRKYTWKFPKIGVPQNHGFQYQTVCIWNIWRCPILGKTFTLKSQLWGRRWDPVGLRTIPTEAFNAERCWTTFFSARRDGVSITMVAAKPADLQSTCELRTHMAAW